MTRFETTAVGLAAVIAALVYLGRQVRKIATGISFWSGLPDAHRELAEASRANTKAIADLTRVVDKMTRLDGRRKD